MIDNMRMGLTYIVAICLVAAVPAANLRAADSGSLLTRYTHWPTKVQYGDYEHHHVAVVERLPPNTPVLAGPAQNTGWSALYVVGGPDSAEATRLGYVKSSLLHASPAVSAPAMLAVGTNTITATEGNALIRDAISLAGDGHFDQAVERANRALSLTCANLGPNHPDVAACLTALGEVYHLGENYEVAKELYVKALRIDEKIGTNQYNLASDYQLVALCHQALEEYSDAEACFSNALARFSAAKGSNSVETTYVMQGMTTLYRKTERPQLVAEYEERIKVNERRHARSGVAYTRPSGRGGPYIDFGIFGNRTPGAPITDGEIRALNFVAEMFEAEQRSRW